MSASSSLYFAQTQSPLGTIILVASGGSICGLYFDDQPDCPVFTRNSYNPGTDAFRVDNCCPRTERAVLSRTIDQLHQWFAHQRTCFNIPVHFKGTAFQRMVWSALQTIPYGQTLTYGEISVLVSGNTKSSRAVGAAIGQNPISIIVPCHRVVGKDGRLTGFSGGLHRKSALLAHEGLSLV